MVREGETYTHKNITIVILEVREYTTFAGRKELMIAYRLKDGRYTSPTAHFWMPQTKDINVEIRKIVEHYLNVRAAVV